MAAVTEVSRQNNNKCRVSVRSSQTLSSISDPVLAGIRNVIGKNISWSEEEKQRCLDRFKEIYESTLKDNIVVDGKSPDKHQINNDNGRETMSLSEMEPVDEAKRKHLNTNTLLEIDKSLILVTLQRKTMPVKAAQQLARQCKHECHYARRARACAVESSEDHETASKSADNVPTQDIQPVMKSVASTVSDCIKSLPSILEDAEHLEKASAMLAVDCRTVTDQVLFHPLPEEDQMAQSLTSLRKRLHDHTQSPATPQKRLRQQVDMAGKTSLRRNNPRRIANQ